MNKLTIKLLIAYAIMGLFAFGHSAGKYRTTVPNNGQHPAFHNAASGMMSGIFWPLYVSWCIFEEEAPKNER